MWSSVEKQKRSGLDLIEPGTPEQTLKWNNFNLRVKYGKLLIFSILPYDP